MSKKHYFSDQKFALLFIYSSAGFFADRLKDFVTDNNGESLVISGRSSILEKPGSFLSNPGVLEPPADGNYDIYRQLWSEHKIYSDIELLDQYNNNQEIVDYIRQIGINGSRPFAHRAIILTNEPSEEIKLDAPEVVLIKRGGFELVVEYLLSSFNIELRHQIPSNESILSLKCDDGENRLFDFSLRDSFDELEESDTILLDGDYDFTSEEIRRSIFNIDNIKLRELVGNFLIPYRVKKILTKDQKEALKSSVPSELIDYSDYIGIEVFKLQLPNKKIDSYLKRQRAISRFAMDEINEYIGFDDDDN